MASKSVKLPQINGQDPAFNRYQTQMQTALAPITNNPMATATQCLVNNKADIALLANQVNKIPTGLGAPIQGYIITRIKGNAVVWDTQDSNTTEANSMLYMNCSANVTIQLSVY